MQELHIFAARVRFLFFNFIFLMDNIQMVIKWVSLTWLCASQSQGVCPSFAIRLEMWWLSKCHLCMLWAAGGIENLNLMAFWCKTGAKLLVSFVLSCKILYLATAPREPQIVEVRLYFVHSKTAWKCGGVFPFLFHFLFIFQSFSSRSGTALIFFNMSSAVDYRSPDL